MLPSIPAKGSHHQTGGSNSYVPTAVTAYIQIIDGGGCAVWTDLGDTYSTLAAWPTVSGGHTRACGVFNGTHTPPVPTGDKNVLSITRNGAGGYTITFKRPIPQRDRVVTIGLGAPGFAFIFAETDTSMTIRTQNTAGSLADFARISFDVKR